MSCGGGFSEVYIKSSHFSLHGFGKRAVLIPVIPSQEGGGEIRNVSLESCSQILQETRIQNLVQFTGRKQNLKNNSTRILYPQRYITETYLMLITLETYLF